ncbi:MAG: hypothetical protein KTR14_02135 [Vampirovibrio sp.]|nr:hypothetical protein [Vampirovibrio sp.]
MSRFFTYPLFRLGILLAVIAGCASLIQPAAEAGLFSRLMNNSSDDTLHMYNGEVVQGQMVKVSGDLIEFKPLHGNRLRLTRLQVNGRQDVLITTDGEKFLGEVFFVSPFALEMKTSQGYVRFSRLKVSRIVFGQPLGLPGQEGGAGMLESSGQMEAAPQTELP